MALLEIQLRPTTPWRAGHRAGDRERVDTVYHSDALYSAVTHAMSALGWLDEWLDATARAEAGSLVRFSSLFPVVNGVRLVPPPKTTWPPAAPGKLYAKAAKLVPLEVALHGMSDESKWMVDGATECLLPAGTAAPFTVSIRSAAAVDRLTGNVEPHRTACLEFAAGAGWWGLLEIRASESDQWEARVKSALRLLADSGFGGERSLGWGRAAEPEFADAPSLFPAAQFPASDATALWLLSLYSPHADDAIDWSGGSYSAIARGGWTDSRAGAARKKHVRMIEEGSVLAASSLKGRAVNVAPDGFPHPAYRAGFALAVGLPGEVTA